MNSICRFCSFTPLRSVLDFGAQALCNRYLSSPGESEEYYPSELVQCPQCEVIQIRNPASASALKSRFDWITYNEQEGHLDDLVERITSFPDVKKNHTIGAVCYKDDTTVDRFIAKGFRQTWRLDMISDLGVNDPMSGIETVQNRLTPKQARHIVTQRGQADLLLCRHILEHAHDPVSFTQALQVLVRPGGYVVFEVPDSLKPLQRKDYALFWEEHVAYFTPETLTQSIQRLGFKVFAFFSYPYAQEDALIVIARVSPPGSDNVPNTHDENLTQLATAYSEGFTTERLRVHRVLTDYRTKGGKIAIFGAGHLSCFWVNAMRLENLVDFVVDDHPKKRGHFMPGSHLPIKSSDSLIEEDVTLCLLSLSPESEQRVRQRQQAYLDKGGIFASLFPGKPNSI